MNVTAEIATAAAAYLAQRHHFLIDGEQRLPQSNATIDVLDPSNGRRVSQVPAGDAVDIDIAVRAARASFEDARWRGKPGDERARILWRFAELIDENADLLAELEMVTNGMPRAFADWEVRTSAGWMRHFAGYATRIGGKNASACVSDAVQQYHAYSAQEPVGVVGLIVPWNGPIGLFIIKVAPALAAGCSCVLKPAEDTPITALLLAELAEKSGLPPGVLNVVTGYGATAGAALVRHPDVDKISFTGSTETGKGIVRAAADTLKRLTLELGGKSPCIVYDDADLETAVPGAAMAIFANTGQICFAGSRLYVQRSVFDKVLSGVADFAKSLKIGAGSNPANMIGPLVSARQRERVENYIELGRAEGGEIVLGGGRSGSEGFFVEPTIFVNTKASTRIIKEEIFGPVLVATPFDEPEEVIALANDTRYGLGAGIFTTNLSRAHKTASRLRAGNVWINCYGLMNPALPFGGFKESGWGREMGEEGLQAFLETKSVYAAL